MDYDETGQKRNLLRRPGIANLVSLNCRQFLQLLCTHNPGPIEVVSGNDGFYH